MRAHVVRSLCRWGQFVAAARQAAKNRSSWVRVAWQAEEDAAAAQTVAQYEEGAAEGSPVALGPATASSSATEHLEFLPRATGEPSAAPIHGQDLGAAVEEQQL